MALKGTAGSFPKQVSDGWDPAVEDSRAGYGIPVSLARESSPLALRQVPNIFLQNRIKVLDRLCRVW